MGLLDGLIGGAIGAGVATVTAKFIEEHGGVQGIVNQMQSRGLGDTVKSWVSTGPNQPITAERLHEVFGANAVADMARRVGMTPEELTQKLAQVLPQAVDHLTPGGALPPAA